MKICLNEKIFELVSNLVEDHTPAFVIGGYVRDLLLEMESKDIDIVVLGSGISLAEKVAKALGPKVRVTVFKNFGTAMLQWKDQEIEFVGARKESYLRNSRKPIVEDGTLEDDQKRRDFTINALAVSLNKSTFGNFNDPFNGISDLKNKIIRTPLEADRTFSDDPLRMMRAIRFASQLNFNIEEETFKAISRNKERIKIISKERINEELNKILLSDTPSKGFKMLDKSGLLGFIFPELENLKGVDSKEGLKHKDNFLHTLKVLDNLSEHTKDLWLLWAALFHDIAKPATKKFIPGIGWTFHGHEFLGAKMLPGIFKKMKLPSNEKMKFVQKMVLLHLRPIVLSQDVVTDSAVRRLLFDAGDDIDKLMMLCEADITSKNDVIIKKHLKNYKIVRQKLTEIEEKEAIRNFQPSVSGEMIMKTFDLAPSKEVGIIKEAIKEAILDGIIQNNYQEAFDFMLKEAQKLGLNPAE